MQNRGLVESMSMQNTGEIAAGAVDIWIANLELSPARLSDLTSALSADEIARADRFKFERDRQRFIAARGTLRVLLGRYLDQDPARLRFNYGPHGKPALTGLGHGRSLYFNVSHSGGRALYAVTEAGDVGVDLEMMQDDFPVEDVAAHVFTAAEMAALLQVSGVERNVRFFTYWTRKEAYCKAMGVGITFDPRRIDAAKPLGVQSGKFMLKSDGVVDKAYTVCDLMPGDNYAGAVAVAGNGCAINVREFEVD